MTRAVSAGALRGTVRIPASKSHAHRLLICAALGQTPVTLLCDGLSRDIEATISCLQGLGANVRAEDDRVIHISPIAHNGDGVLRCGESGSTLRFLLPVSAALGQDVTFCMEGRLPQRPLDPLDVQLTAHGVTLTRQGDTLRCCGQLTGGDYTLSGNVSSQYISGLLMALPLLPQSSTLTITGQIESAAYIAMTEDALRQSGVVFTKEEQTYHIPGCQSFTLPAQVQVEGDWSNAAFFLCAGALSSEGVTVTGLNTASSQGDRAIVDLLRAFGAQINVEKCAVSVRKGQLRGITVDAAPIPDLVPVISVVAAAAEGKTHIINAARLRLKESDRLTTTAALLRAVGGTVQELPDGLIVTGSDLTGGTVDSSNDHRIAMSAAVAACRCDVTVLGSSCVNKSYPRFWEDYASVKGAGL